MIAGMIDLFRLDRGENNVVSFNLKTIAYANFAIRAEEGKVKSHDYLLPIANVESWMHRGGC